MFFCINLVFATSVVENARIIQQNVGPDITVNLVNTEYVLTNAVLDPATNDNIETYIVKDNVPIIFSFQNVEMDPKVATLQNYYYRRFGSKNLKIRCMDTMYYGGTMLKVLPDSIFNVLNITKKVEDYLFIFEFEYKVNNNGVDEIRNAKYAFKIVSDKGYEMYQNIEKDIDIEETNEGKEIRRPKRIKE